jgi:dTDP-4-amino-4,6-dideoxy-D-galactose acyltransferase
VSLPQLSAQILTWDTRLLGFPVARIDGLSTDTLAIAEILAALRRKGVGLAYARTPGGPHVEAAATQAGGKLVNRRVTYTADLRSDHDSEAPADFEIVPCSGPLTPALESLALASGSCSRFRVDPRIPEPVFEELYRTWILKSVTHELAERVFVARVRGAERGMVTVASEGDRGTIGLIAVEERERGLGLGRALLRCARQYHLAMGRPILQVVTQQRNVSACKLYERSGFRVERNEAEYHFWL